MEFDDVRPGLPQGGAEFNLAVELNPNGVEGHEGLANYLAATGELDQSVVEMRRARELDPLSLIVNTDLCITLYLARRYDEALVQCNATLGLDRRVRIHQLTGAVYAAKEMYGEAVSEFREADKLDGNPYADEQPSPHEQKPSAVKDYWQSALKHGVDKIGGARGDPFLIAKAYAFAEEDDKTLTWLERAYEARSFGIVYLGVYPLFDRLHPGPRFPYLSPSHGPADYRDQFQYDPVENAFRCLQGQTLRYRGMSH